MFITNTRELVILLLIIFISVGIGYTRALSNSWSEWLNGFFEQRGGDTLTRREQIIQAIELLEEKKLDVMDEVIERRNYRTSVESLVIESLTVQEKIQSKIDRLYKELEKEGVLQ